MDCLSTPVRQKFQTGKNTVKNHLFDPQEQINALLNHMARLEQRLLLQRYEINVLEAEMEVLRSESYIM